MSVEEVAAAPPSGTPAVSHQLVQQRQCDPWSQASTAAQEYGAVLPGHQPISQALRLP
jgi:hypothetical protein